jgi:RimJ/RimL family protein N-acetyltransferase
VDASVEGAPSHFVRLRAARSADVDFLYHVVLADEQTLRLRYRGRWPSPDEFRAELWRNTLALQIVETPRRGERFGVVIAYQPNYRNQTVYVAAAAVDQYRTTGLVISGLAALVDNLFANWQFRKIYLEVLEFNLSQFASAEGRIFEVEGRLRDFEYWAGRWWDLILATIDRERWPLILADHDLAVRSLSSELSSDQSRFVSLDDFVQVLLQLSPSLRDSGPINPATCRLVDDLGFTSIEFMMLLDLIETQVDSSIDGPLAGVRTVQQWFDFYRTVVGGNHPVASSVYAVNRRPTGAPRRPTGGP